MSYGTKSSHASNHISAQGWKHEERMKNGAMLMVYEVQIEWSMDKTLSLAPGANVQS